MDMARRKIIPKFKTKDAPETLKELHSLPKFAQEYEIHTTACLEARFPKWIPASVRTGQEGYPQRGRKGAG